MKDADYDDNDGDDILSFELMLIPKSTSMLFSFLNSPVSVALTVAFKFNKFY